MIVMEMSCGLGNQMFQYAVGRTLSVRYNVPLLLDISCLSHENSFHKRAFNLGIFNLPSDVSVRRSVFPMKIVQKSSKLSFLMPLLAKGVYKATFVEESDVLASNQHILGNSRRNIYLRGYWQHKKYAVDIEHILQKDFVLKEKILPHSTSLLSQIEGSNSVCLHIRRGDYVHSVFDVLNETYFLQASRRMEELVPNPSFFIFSDDIAWCKQLIKLPYPTSFVEDMHNGDMNANCALLMTSCKHFIISNSTFSWWMAFLGKHPQKKVVAPSVWKKDDSVSVDDLLPSSWIRL